jgi:hypothetical protein
LCRYEVTFDLRGGDLPGPLCRAAQQTILQRLVVVKQAAEADYGAEEKIMAALQGHHHLEEQLAAAEDAAKQARGEAARAATRGEDVSNLERTAMEADEHVRTLTAALDRCRTADDIRAGLANRLEGRLKAEAEKIRAEVQARQSEARRRLAEAVKDLLLEVALADADALLVQVATPAQRSLFGSAVGWLDVQVTGLVPGHLRPRGINENHTAPMSRGF